MFPILMSITPLLKAVEGMPEIGIREDHEHGYGYVSYQVAFEDTFKDPFATTDPAERERRLLVREARGIKYDLKTLRIVSRPYHKFHNVGERADTMPDVIDFTKPHVILEKLDGSMLTPLFRSEDGVMRWMTKRGVTSVADTALAFSDANPQYEQYCRTVDALGFTPIFEWCSRAQRIILDYPQDRLVLTGLRHNETGIYHPYEIMKEFAESMGVEVVRALPGSVENIRKFMAEVKDLKGEEGYIIRFDDGSMYKIKGEWYCEIHRTFDNLRFEKDVIRLILSDKLDDAKSFMLETLRGAIDRFTADLRANVAKLAEFLYWEYTAAKDNTNGSKKKFVEFVQSRADLLPYQGALFRAYDKDLTQSEIFDHLLEYILKNVSTQTKVNEMRHYFGGLEWADYLKEPISDDA